MASNCWNCWKLFRAKNWANRTMDECVCIKSKMSIKVWHFYTPRLVFTLQFIPHTENRIHSYFYTAYELSIRQLNIQTNRLQCGFVGFSIIFTYFYAGFKLFKHTLQRYSHFSMLTQWIIVRVIHLNGLADLGQSKWSTQRRHQVEIFWGWSITALYFFRLFIVNVLANIYSTE